MADTNPVRAALRDTLADLFADACELMLFASDEHEIAGNPLWTEAAAVIR